MDKYFEKLKKTIKIKWHADERYKRGLYNKHPNEIQISELPLFLRENDQTITIPNIDKNMKKRKGTFELEKPEKKIKTQERMNNNNSSEKILTND